MYLIVLSILVTLMQENPEYSVFSLQTVGLYCILVGLFQKLGNSSQMLANPIEFSENSGNSGQNAQYGSQMATLFVDFPEYSGHSNQIVTISWGFFRNSGNSCQNAHINVTFFSIHNYINVL